MAKPAFGAVDRFKWFAALLVIAIHTGPLDSYSPKADFLIIGVLARLAVPFFFAASGYFFFGKLTGEWERDRTALRKFLVRIGLLYGAGIAAYLPLNVYSGYFEEPRSAWGYASDLLFNGTFYHLWYLPALMLGTCIVYALRLRLTDRMMLAAASVLYAFALLGDSYYGLAEQSSFLAGLYDHLFRVFDYTRNGIGFAPLYIGLGAALARGGVKERSLSWLSTAFLASLSLLVVEGIALRDAGWPRHDSMYVVLVPAVYYLFRLLLALGGAQRRQARQASTWIYLLHPLAIVGVRGIAKATGLTSVLVRDSLVHYAAVALLSIGLAAAVGRIVRISERWKRCGDNLPHRAWTEIDLDYFAHNANVLRSRLPAGTELMAVVKADAYGHGSVRVAKRLYAEGVRSFAVAEIDEAIALRKGGVRGDILVLGYTPTHRLRELSRYRLTQTVVNAEDAERLQAAGKKLRVHVKIDTGMNRLGEPWERIERILSIYRQSRLQVSGTFSHLAAADGMKPGDIAFTRVQVVRFEEVVRQLRAAGIDPGKLHLQSSYGIVNYPELRYDLARPGIALYGLLSNERDKLRSGLDLRPVLSLKATVTRVNDVRAGEFVGYGRSFAALRDSRIATLSIGYADGIPRGLPERGGCVLVRGRRAPMVGKICMDQMTVDVTDIDDDVRQGDTVTLIGQDGEERITVEEVAGWAGTISNEIVSSLGARLDRQYLERTS
ncbi:serine racemase VanT catalytic subunit [Cohnella xylanilytica]|uniref:Alanine racemase n=1 Tax=Cohnella xylanilytica TaxID=557555 RepID=A0A841TRF3_9BACL|nr:serine racemase VanT catalytic subunit [Cohnella xylanilytica]MBB6690967.1 serine racemase VanT catalytic subunit [Cohnella xylanilytica]